MNLTTFTAKGTKELKDISELAIEFDCDAKLTCADPLNAGIPKSIWQQQICKGATLTLVEPENKLSVKEAARQYPYVILRLDRLEKINFSDIENAVSDYNNAGILGRPRALFEFNEKKNSYYLLKISMF